MSPIPVEEEMVQRKSHKESSRSVETSSPGLSPEMIERAARGAALSNGDDFDKIHRNKTHWVETHGHIGNRFRGIDDMKQIDYIEIAEATLRAALGDTHVMVPREPTKDMRLAANRAWSNGDLTAYFHQKVTIAVEGYRAMIAATQAQPGEDASAAPTDCLVPSCLNPSSPSQGSGT